METIKELRGKLQTNVLGHPYLQRIPSIYITRLLLPTNIQANQVTVVMFIVGVLGAISIFFGWIWLGLFLVYFSIILDAVDGEIARYRKVFSLRGVYLDLVNHHVMPGIFFLAFTFWVADIFNTPNTLVLIVGVLGSLALILRRANGDIFRGLFVRPYSENPGLYPTVSTYHKTETIKKVISSSFSLRKFLSPLAKIVYSLHYFAVMVIIVFLASLLELVLFPETNNHPILFWFIIVYGITNNSYLIREIIGEYFSVEGKIGKIADTFKERRSVNR